MRYRKLFVSLLVLPILLFGVAAYAVDTSDYKAVLGDKKWGVDSDGDFNPLVDSSYEIGASGNEVEDIHTDSVTLGGSAKTSWANSLMFSVADFIINDQTSIAPITTSTTPGLELDNKNVSIVWADGEVTPVQVTFKVPSDYISGAGFRLFCDESSSTTPNQVDFNVYVNEDGEPFDTSASNQTPVALAGTAGTPDMVVLSTIATDFASLSAGDVVTLSLWRDNAAAGTGDLELYYVEFYYSNN